MITLVSILLVLASILLIAVIFVQNPKGGGLSSDFGAAQQLGGVQRTSDFIEKATWVLASFILIASIAMTSMMKPEKPKAVAPTQQQQQQQSGGNAPVGQQ